MTPTFTGIDLLERDQFAPLTGTRIGLVTNHTGLTRDGRTTIDVLHDVPYVQLTALFSPEHGIRGVLDEIVDDSIDSRTGLPIHSLYGDRRKPTSEQLNGIDTLVFDIQDIGCRFYTYISTLGNVMEAVSEQNKRLVVLDRPNPITGTHIEGPNSDTDKQSFTAWHSIPIRHGLTIGEMAQLFKAEREMKCELTVIPCEGWHRDDWFDAGGLIWTNPSPNMRSLSQATVYSGVGLLEMTNISVGRGTDTPFEFVGAPYIDPQRFSALLNDAEIPGIRFIPVRFTPKSSVFADDVCGGVNLYITDRNALNSVRIGFEIAIALRTLYSTEWHSDRFINLLANTQTFEHLLSGGTYAELANGWSQSLNSFAQRRSAHLLY